MQVIFLFIQSSFFRGNHFVPDTADNLPPMDCSLPNLRGEKKGGGEESKAGVDRQERGGLSNPR